MRSRDVLALFDAVGLGATVDIVNRPLELPVVALGPQLTHPDAVIRTEIPEGA